jgi:uncharacterized protein YdiU (UPF0061 family)
MRAKLGLPGEQERDGALVDDLAGVLQAGSVDFTSFFRALARAARGDAEPVRSLLTEPSELDAWLQRWRTRLGSVPPQQVADAMDAVNPVYIPRNQRVEEALAAATAGDLAPLGRLLEALTDPFSERPGLEAYAEPAPPSFATYQTFCGT